MGKYIESDIQIRFADADSLGHINNVNLQHYFDVGKMEFYEKVLGKTIDPDAESLILVSIHTNYHRQSRLTRSALNLPSECGATDFKSSLPLT